MKRLRVGLVGAGLVGQAEHAFYLWEERARFDFVGLADASAAVRSALGARYAIPELHADLPSLLKATKLDALVIAAPDPFHPDLAATALEAGLHVLCDLAGEGLHGGRRGVLGQFGLQGLGERGGDAGGPAHRAAPSDARTPPEESVRRRMVPPWGGGGTWGARRACGVGGQARLPAECVDQPTVDREGQVTV